MHWKKKEYDNWILSGRPVNKNVTHLGISFTNIKGPIQLNNLPNLQKLNCSYNQITNIQELQLPNLQELYCYHNKITEIQELQLPNLRTLYCSRNQITEIQKLQLPNLKDLNCSYNQITEIQELQLPNLQELNCNNNQIINLSFILHTVFRSLYYANNPVEYISPNVNRFLNRSKTTHCVYKDSQNVHNHYVQDCIQKSIARIIGMKPTILNVRDYIVKDEVLTETVKRLLMEYMDDNTVHSVIQITFGELLISVLSVIDAHEESSEIKRILNVEIADSECKCYTGRMSRLINCLNGYSDCVNIHISDSEQIGNIIQIEKNKLEETNEYSAEKHREMVTSELEIRNYSKEIIDEWVSYID